MSDADSSRRLHGVLLADMTGFSRLMGEDETRAFAALARIRDVFTTVVPRYGGTLDVLVGDCFVALFGSAVEAVQAAIAIQTELAGATGPAGDPVRIRIGVHLGDVVRSGSDILGDSVNVAARLQTIARPGGITLSEDVHRAVRNRISLPVRDLGPKTLKNIREKIRVFEIDVAGGTDRPAATSQTLRPVVLALVGVVVLAGLGIVGYRLAAEGPALGVPAVGGPVAAVPATAAPPAPAPSAPPAPLAVAPKAGAQAAAELLTVGVTNVSVSGDVPPWMQDNTRDGLNTLLSKVPKLRVFSREKIDFLRERRGLSEIEVAETLGIQKMIVGSLAMDDGDVVLQARVVDIATGILDASETTRGTPDELVDLQNQLAAHLLAALHVQLSPDERTLLFAKRSNESLDGYRRMFDTFGEAAGEPAAPAASGKTSWLAWPSVAWAADDAAATVAIEAVLEAYRAALQAKDVDGVAKVHVELSSDQRDGFVRYFASADDLSVTVTDVDVLLDGNEALATFTRRDEFKDHNSGKDVHLEVRLSSVVVQQDGKWLMRGVKRSS